MGQFTLETNADSPVILLSAGVRITPMLSMVEHLVENQPNREVHFIHGSRNKEVQPALPRLYWISGQCENFHLSVLHSYPSEDEQPGIDYHVNGRLTKEIIPLCRDLLTTL
jgi:nitric oxide dioxygenase